MNRTLLIVRQTGIGLAGLNFQKYAARSHGILLVCPGVAMRNFRTVMIVRIVSGGQLIICKAWQKKPVTWRTQSIVQVPVTPDVLLSPIGTANYGTQRHPETIQRSTARAP